MNILFRSLFLKIFLWFGTIVITVIVGTFIAGEVNRQHEPPCTQPFDQLLDTYAQEAAREFEAGGQAALATYLERVERESRIRAFLFNDQLQELTGRRHPADAPEVAHRAFQSHHSHVAEHRMPPLFARVARTESGAEYVLVAEPPRRSPPTLLHPAMHLIAIILTGGLFCYWLARYLTSPVTKLRAATKELAKGNLNARVVPEAWWPSRRAGIASRRLRRDGGKDSDAR